MKKIFGILLIFILFVSILGKWQSVQASTSLNEVVNTGTAKFDQTVQETLDNLQSGEMLTAIVTMADQADLSQIPGASRAARQQGVIRALQAKAEASQRQIQALLAARSAQGKVSRVTSFWVFNGLSVTATPDVFQELAARADVQFISPDDIQIVPEALNALAAPETNLSVINAPALWSLSLYGQGVVVANMDSGVDANHPDLAARWRGGSNSWFDPYGQHPTTPTDLSGHGTQTMGLMVAGDAGGTSIGVAPQAQWIAVKIFNDNGSATATAIHLGFQWLLDPDGNPATADAPQVVNNSWAYGSSGCNLEFQNDLRSLRAVGILPVFSAGNFGPGSSTSTSPANYPEAFAVGATDNNNQVYDFSSRGPSACGESQTVYPEMVAPGVNVRSTNLFGTYTSATGTSLAAPHVSGGLALLLAAYPDLSAAEQENALINSAVDIGASGPDNVYGYGRVDLLSAFNWLATAPTVTPTPLPTFTPTPTLDPNVNLALNKPVTVSSELDSADAGGMAVDGDLGTLWKTIRYSGKNKPASDWITVDLGSSQVVSQVVLEWDAYYATRYSIDVSSNNNNWTTVFSTTSTNGGNDTIYFTQISARYVRLMTTGWSNSSLRNWLKEIQVFSGSSSSPASTPTPNPTPTPSPTPPPSGSSITMHIGDLDAQSSTVNRKNWSATITVRVHDTSENPIAGATVSGTWSGGISGTGSCSTDVNGTCQIASSNINNNISAVTFSATSVVRSPDTYSASANHDPDGDSNGTTLTISRP